MSKETLEEESFKYVEENKDEIIKEVISRNIKGKENFDLEVLIVQEEYREDFILSGGKQ